MPLSARLLAVLRAYWHEARPPGTYLFQGTTPGQPIPQAALDIADIVRTHGAAYRREHALSFDQRTVLRAIATCRTPVRGGHLDVCDTCGHTRPAYNSCRNRHGPKCQALAAARWVDARMARLLPTPYFHVVFTLPAALRGLASMGSGEFTRQCFSS